MRFSIKENWANPQKLWASLHLPRKACKPETLLKREPGTDVFSCEFCEIFKNNLFYRTLPVGAFKVVKEVFTKYTAQKMKFPVKNFLVNVRKPKVFADLFTFTKEILNGKLHA